MGPRHILHISKTERVRFEALVNANPSTGPLALVVGIPGINGPGESVADISDVFLNAGRVGKERLKLKSQSLSGGNSLIAAFAKSAAHPGFVIYSQLNAVTVISVQSPFMRSQMDKERLLGGPINGLASIQRQKPGYDNHSPHRNINNHRTGANRKLVRNTYQLRKASSRYLGGPLTNRTRAHALHCILDDQGSGSQGFS